ncbi:MAG: hypothetical protein ACLGIA_02710 [Actinomycetes bacterium]
MSQTPGNVPAEALVGAAASKAGLVWVSAAGQRALPLWHVWHDAAVLVVVGGEEQPDPVPEGADVVEVRVPSKDNGSRLVTFRARVEHVRPDDDRWEASVFRLRGDRLNALDADTMVERWAASSRVLRFVPTGELLEKPGDYDSSSEAAPPPDTPATTVSWRPFHLGGRKRRRHRLG